MTRNTRWSALAVVIALMVSAAPSFAQSPLAGALGFQPRVPVSAFSRPAAWFDPSRLHVSTMVSVGSGWGGGTGALQVTSLNYQFSKPAWLEVSLGNAWGQNSAPGSGMFLEGLRFGFKPTSNSVLSIQFQNVRSPLQLSRDPYSSWGW
jgi:hypothetical protein